MFETLDARKLHQKRPSPLLTPTIDDGDLAWDMTDVTRLQIILRTYC